MLLSFIEGTIIRSLLKLLKGFYTRYFHSQNTNNHGTNSLQSETKDNLDQFNFHQSSAHDLLSLKADCGGSIAIDTHNKDVNCQPVSGSLYERETDRLLDGLGPRFIDWWMHKPLPVDGDLLPEVAPGFELPFRLSPPYANSKLTDDELTYLRKLAHPLPVHFVLGWNRRLQGLASAILKLWEKSLIAKIALKYGVPNTDNDFSGAVVASSAFMAEALAARKAAEMVKQTNGSCNVIETDNEILHGALASGDIKSCEWKSQVIVEDTLALLSSKSAVSFNVVPRTLNKAADWLAANGSKGLSLDDWVNRPPPRLAKILDKDRVQRQECLKQVRGNVREGIG